MRQLSYFKIINKNPSKSIPSTISKIRLRELKKQTTQNPQIMMGLCMSNTKIFNSSGILSHFAGMCLFSLKVEVGSVAVPGRRSHWVVVLKSWVFLLSLMGCARPCCGLLRVWFSWWWIDIFHSSQEGRWCCWPAALQTFPILPWWWKYVIRFRRCGKKGEGRKPLSFHLTKRKLEFWKDLLVRWELLSLLACPPPPFTSPTTCEASGGGAPCCAYAHCYVNLNKSCKLKRKKDKRKKTP